MAHKINSESIKELYKEINMRMLDCIEKDCVPYFNDNPLPQDMNVINGRHFGDINKILLELKAYQIGARSLKWIYKADADFLGLELKENFNTTPLIVYANINRDGVNNNTEAQKIFLLDQFTDKSVKTALELTRTEGKSDIEIQRRGIAENMIQNITEYDSGKNEFILRANKRKNISANCKDPKTLKEVSSAYENITQFYDNSQKMIFGTLNKFFICQETGLKLSKPMSVSEKEQLKAALLDIAKVDSPCLTQTLTECFLYSERLTHFGFSPERIYKKEDLNKNLTIFAPLASYFEPKKVFELEREKQAEKKREREHKIKPRSITHQRGLL